MSLQKTIVIKETSFNDLEQGSTFIDFHTHYSKFMDDPKFYHQVFHSNEDVITFVSNEDLKVVKKSFDLILGKIGEIIFDIKNIYIRHSSSNVEFENELSESYPKFFNVRLIDDDYTHRKYVVFEWLSRTWMIYI